MLPTQERIRELRERFDVTNGRVLSDNRYTNLNWYFNTSAIISREEPGDWFCYGDIDADDINRLQNLLKEGETIIVGWKNLQPNERWSDIFKDGGGVRMVIGHKRVLYDRIRDGQIKESKS